MTLINRIILIWAGLMFINPALEAQNNSEAMAQNNSAVINSIAYRVHDIDKMMAFYSEAFNVDFKVEITGEIESYFGNLGGITLKFVPIRNEQDFENFPIHQPGIVVSDVNQVIEIAIKYGGRIVNQPERVDGRLLAAIRDPDGNTIELYEAVLNK